MPDNKSYKLDINSDQSPGHIFIKRTDPSDGGRYILPWDVLVSLLNNTQQYEVYDSKKDIKTPIVDTRGNQLTQEEIVDKLNKVITGEGSNLLKLRNANSTPDLPIEPLIEIEGK